MALRVVSPSNVPAWWRTDHGIDLILKIFAVVAMAIGAIRIGRANVFDERIFWVLISIAILTFVLEVYKFFLRQKTRPSGSDIHALDAVVQTIHSAVLSLANGDHRTADLRMCVFVPDHKSHEVVHQLTDYIGPIPRYGINRKISSRSGAVGDAIREGVAMFLSPDKKVQTIDYLVKKGFHRNEAAQMDLERRSWAAIPIGIGPNNVAAVLYADAKTQSFWGIATDNKRKVMIAAALAIALHISPS